MAPTDQPPATNRWFFPIIGLVFLAFPASEAFKLPGVTRILVLGLLLGLAACFYVAMIVTRAAHWAGIERTVWTPRRRLIIGCCLAGMTIILLATAPFLEEGTLSYVAYIDIVLVTLIRRLREGLVIAVITLVLVDGAQRMVPGWDHSYYTTFGVAVGGFAMVMAVVSRERTLAARRAEEENRRLEKEAEKLRVSRDVHDVLGHSLTVIALKAQLASKLQAAGAPEAGRHIDEIGRLARAALADVRQTVQGTREVSLAEELVTATRALRAADIEVEAPVSVDDVDPELRELFAWAVREASTNILRHARANWSRIIVDTQSLQVSNDGADAVPELTDIGSGAGLRGLQDRARAIGADVSVSAVGGCFVLEVARSGAGSRDGTTRHHGESDHTAEFGDSAELRGPLELDHCAGLSDPATLEDPATLDHSGESERGHP